MFGKSWGEKSTPPTETSGSHGELAVCDEALCTELYLYIEFHFWISFLFLSLTTTFGFHKLKLWLRCHLALTSILCFSRDFFIFFCRAVTVLSCYCCYLQRVIFPSVTHFVPVLSLPSLDLFLFFMISNMIYRTTPNSTLLEILCNY